MNPDLKTRIAGVTCVLAGAAISWPTIFDRLRLAEQGVPEISTWSLASFLVGPLIVIGLTMMIFGARAEALTRNAEKKRLTLFGNFIALGSVLNQLAGEGLC